MFIPPNGQYLLRTTHCFLTALMSAGSKFQNHVYENEDETHKIKQLLKKLLVQLPTRGTETMAVLPATIKHLIWTSKQIPCNKSRFLRVLTLIVCFWKSYTAGKLWMEEVILCQVTRVVWPGYPAVLMCIPWHTPSCCLHGVLSLLLLHQVGCMLKVLLKGSC